MNDASRHLFEHQLHPTQPGGQPNADWSQHVVAGGTPPAFDPNIILAAQVDQQGPFHQPFGAYGGGPMGAAQPQPQPQVMYASHVPQQQFHQPQPDHGSPVMAAPAPSTPRDNDPVVLGAIFVSTSAVLLGGLWIANSAAPSQAAAVALSALWIAAVAGGAFGLTAGRRQLRLAATVAILVSLAAAGGIGAARTAQVNHRVNDRIPAVGMGSMAAGHAMQAGGAAMKAGETGGGSSGAAMKGNTGAAMHDGGSGAAMKEGDGDTGTGSAMKESDGDGGSASGGAAMHDGAGGAAASGAAMHSSVLQPGSASRGGTVPSNVEVAHGSFASLAHDTSGAAQLVQLGNGRTQLVLRNFATAAGPDLQVYLVPGSPSSDAGVKGYLSLGALKGTSGNQVYTLPPGVDASQYGSVVIWCRLATVRFGQADLRRG